MSSQITNQVTDYDDLERQIRRLGRLKVRLQAVEVNYHEAIQIVDRQYKPRIQRLRERIEPLQAAIEAYALAHRDELLRDGSRTATLRYGQLKYRTTPASVRISDTVEAVCRRLRDLGLGHLIRTTESVDKRALAADPRAHGIEGVEVALRTETVQVVPIEA